MIIPIDSQFRIASNTHAWTIQRRQGEKFTPFLHLGSFLNLERALTRTGRHAIVPGGLPVPEALRHLAAELKRIDDLITSFRLPDPKPAPGFEWRVGGWSITADRYQYIVRTDRGRARTYHRHLVDALRHLAGERVRRIEGAVSACLPALDALREELTAAAAQLSLTTTHI